MNPFLIFTLFLFILSCNTKVEQSKVIERADAISNYGQDTLRLLSYFENENFYGHFYQTSTNDTILMVEETEVNILESLMGKRIWALWKQEIPLIVHNRKDTLPVIYELTPIAEDIVVQPNRKLRYLDQNGGLTGYFDDFTVAYFPGELSIANLDSLALIQPHTVYEVVEESIITPQNMIIDTEMIENNWWLIDDKPMFELVEANKERDFEKWITDTLKILPKALQKEDCLTNYFYEIKSSQLIIDKEFNLPITSSTSPCAPNLGEVDAVVETLLTQDSTLTLPFYLQLHIQHSFNKSMAEQLIYEQTTEAKEVLVTKNNRTFSYSIIKGNLKEKEEIINYNND